MVKTNVYLYAVSGTKSPIEFVFSCCECTKDILKSKTGVKCA